MAPLYNCSTIFFASMYATMYTFHLKGPTRFTPKKIKFWVNRAGPLG